MIKKKVLAIMEPPLANTGFGTVSRAILPALASEYEVYLLATGGYGMLDNAELEKFGVKGYQPTQPNDLHMVAAVDQMDVTVQPDVIVTYYDAGSIYNYVEKTHLPQRPHVSYLITESEPMMPAWCRLFNDYLFTSGQSNFDYTIDEIVLPSRYAAQVAFKQTERQCPVGFHGADHANWRKLPKEFKKAQRKELGHILNDPEFEDSFILMYVARNADRKMWPRMFQSLALVKQMAPEINFRLFAYTKDFDSFKNEGWYLKNLISQFGLDPKDVFFPETQEIGGVPFESDLNSNNPSMLKFYNMVDLYVHPSGVEGCGLPILEAAKCGLPILTTKYGGGWEYAQDFAMPIEVSDFYYHKSGIAHAMINVEDCAKKIVLFARNPALVHQYGGMSQHRCNYKWADLGKEILGATNRVYNEQRRALAA